MSSISKLETVIVMKVLTVAFERKPINNQTNIIIVLLSKGIICIADTDINCFHKANVNVIMATNLCNYQTR